MWVDVKPSDWYYNEVMEASRLQLEDGKPFVASIPYNLFDPNAPYVFKEFITTAGQVEFQLAVKVTPTPANPLYVYIDGVQTVYKELVDVGGATKVVLYTATNAGKTVTIASYGKPIVDAFGKPSVGNPGKYPVVQLSAGSSYVYDPFNRTYTETVYAFGKQLKRVQVEDEEWVAPGSTYETVAGKYIGTSSNKYTITPDGMLIAPFNLADVAVTVSYVENSSGWAKPKIDKVTPVSTSILHINRFFPKAYISRAEAIIWINRLRETFYSRFSDIDAPSNILDDTQYAYVGQKLFRVNGYFPAGDRKLVVRVNDQIKSRVNYTELDNHTVLFNEGLEKDTKVNFKYEKLESSRFHDVGRKVTYAKTNGSSLQVNGIIGESWWASGILAIEDETFDNGDYLINGMPVNASGDTVTVDNMLNPLGAPNSVWVMASTCMTRAEVVAYLNRFRKWCVERLK